MERARRELRQVQKASSASVLDIIDHGKMDDGGLYVAHPADGKQELSLNRMDVEQAKGLVASIGSGLAEAQKTGVVHRDLSAYNFVVDAEGNAAVRGFGVAPPANEIPAACAEFMSPEQAAGKPVDQRSNVYSLGALMYRMLSGEAPFTGSAAEVLNKHQNEEPPAIGKRFPQLNIPQPIESLIQKAMAKTSSKRHLTLRQFLRDLDRASGGATAAAESQADVKDQPAATAPSARDSSAAIGATAGNVVAGEMSGGERVRMEAKAAAPGKDSIQPATARPASPGKGRKGFRETMWFFKGDVESQMAEAGEAPAAAEAEAENPDLARKYDDDGTLNAEAANRYSLRTGKTQMMKAVKLPSAEDMPGERMRDSEFIDEINAGGKWVIWVVGGIAVVAIGVLAYAILF